ncbi:MAG: SDR family oxidoreductase [Pirellulaceae bacterium]|jgi:NAD(P)-dependent dehydrogenase (short-subunit alcohol dehydrogenase family)|nr:SDR family oxidoreductase [Pirellulaceae bacterium]MCU0973884.1 SDR family oxidoreductase [Burkholderiales bacterium]
MLTIDLSGTVALVVGGSRGIGAGIAEALARAGAITMITHTGQPQHAERLTDWLNDLRGEGCRIEAEIADACQPDASVAVVTRLLADYGRLDTLVANVGQNLARPLEATTTASWHEFLEMNLSSAFYAVRAALPTMLEARAGCILLIGSSAVHDGGGGAVDYAAAKAGLVGMMRYLTRNYARQGIRTNVIHPAVIETDLLRERYDAPEKRQRLIDQVPLGRLGQPSDIAGLAALLASHWGSFICGQEILVDGGRTLYRGG